MIEYSITSFLTSETPSDATRLVFPLPPYG